MSQASRSFNRSAVREHFLEYPEHFDTASRTYGAASAKKDKVYCKGCYRKHFQDEQEADQKAIRAGLMTEARTADSIELYLWTTSSPDTGRVRYISSQATTMSNHLARCSNVNDPHAIQDAHEHRGNHSPPRQVVRSQSHSSLSLNLHPISTQQPSNVYSSSGIALASTSALSPHPSSSQFSTVTRSSSSSDLYPYDSISAAGSRADSPRPGAMSRQTHSRPSSRARRPPSTYEAIPAAWTDTRRAEYERLMIRLTAAAGFPLSWVDNPEWISFCDKFIPGAPHISRKVLTKRILVDAVKDMQSSILSRVGGQNATLQADGWTGLNNHHLVAFMVSVDRQIYTVSVKDSTPERKHAENFLELIEEAYCEARDTWKLNLVAVVTDASGEARKARRLFRECHPSIIVLDCYSHQVNLVVGDLFKSKSQLLHWSELASQLITWLRSKTRILSHLPLSVIRAVLTRWTAHYMAYRRLLQLYRPLVALVHTDAMRNDDEKVLISGDAASKRKGREMVEIIEDNAFWQNIALLCRYLEPLAIAANVTQQSFCRLDEVLITFGFLVHKYTGMADDVIAQAAILKSVEARWAKADQEVFVAAVLINPLYRTTPFLPLESLNFANINGLLSRLWIRFFFEAPPSLFLEHAGQFLDGTGFFARLEAEAARELDRALGLGQRPDPLKILNQFRHPGRPNYVSPFIRFAQHLFSVSANSASCERLFSTFGNILTKLRNRTGNTVLHNLSLLKMQIRDEHLAQGTKTRLKRRFQAPGRFTTDAASSSRATVDKTISDILSAAGYSNRSEPAATPDVPLPHAAVLDSDVSEREFSNMINEHIEHLTVDKDPTDKDTADKGTTNDDEPETNDDEPEDEDMEEEPPVVMPDWKPVPIADLFDFGAATWVNRFERMGDLSFDQELSLYDFLDLDASGEDVAEDEPDHDSLTQEILMNGYDHDDPLSA